jgi:predicted nucleic acid-binding protein
MNFADTNWLEAMFFDLAGDQKPRHLVVHKFMRRHGGQIGLSHIVYLEARNVFSRVSGEAEPPEWRELLAGLAGRFYLDPMNWDLLRRESFRLFEKYSSRATIGTFDAAVLASAILAGAKRVLSFDETLKALAVAEGLEVFPELTREGLAFLAKLKRPAAGD